MIQKIEKIENLAVFRDFNWDHSVKSEGGSVQKFRAINIIYGRNYSGKTSLSRILRAFETGQISEKYSNPRFSLKLTDGTLLSQSSLPNHSLTLRVFNEDFVRENLRFITNPEEDIEPFAVLGAENNKLEAEIRALEHQLGSEEPSKETGLFAERVSKNRSYDSAQNAHQQAEKELDRSLGQMATEGSNSIKSNTLRFDSPRYNKPLLKADLTEIGNDEYKPLDNGQVHALEKLLDERALQPIPEYSKFNLKLSSLARKAEVLLQKQIGKSDKIQGLLADAVLDRWVREGRTLHRETRQTCGFCGNVITPERWAELERHFDKESDEFEKELDGLIKQVETEKKAIGSAYALDKRLFYGRFHERFDVIKNDLGTYIKDLTQGLDSLSKQLNARKKSLLIAQEYEPITDPSEDIERVLNDLETLRSEANGFTNKIAEEQNNARSALRLHEVYQFSNTINYPEKLNQLAELATKKRNAEHALRRANEEIGDKKRLIAEKKRQLNDEEEGARKVNAYLTHYFGHNFLKLAALEKTDPATGDKKIRFQVMRGDHVAHHLSEGECRLLSFCYFMAKLEDTETKGLKPLIWIDDPISSLDGNHVFFVYSIICDRLIDQQSFEQLFISTHSLDFLKYLRRLPGADHDLRKKSEKRKYQFLIVNRRHDESAVELMPSYLIDHVTEFNHLFHQIYLCSIAEEENDSNYQLFYNFGNNARKFLEMFLFYKFPDSSPDAEKLERFFGQGEIPRFLTDRINNEYSHFSGVFERGALPVVVPEMQRVAKQIIACLKRDKDQFNALLKSIGEAPLPKDAKNDSESTPPSSDQQK
jgi:wobble nucleotide-excising tRNase